MGVSSYTPETIERICTLIASGKTVREICREDQTVPSSATIYRWLSDHPDFREQYARAREAQAHAFNDEIVDTVRNAEDYQRGRLLMDGLKWAASKAAPKIYGDKLTNEHTGADGKPLVVTYKWANDHDD